MLRFRKTSVLLSALAIGSITLLAGPVAATAADGPPAYYPEGPQLNVDQSELDGWTLCYSGAFGENEVPLYGAGGVLSELCTGSYLLIAGGPANSTELQLLAAAPRADALFDTGANSDVTHEANGTAWYFNAFNSWGFAALGDSVSKNSCDTDDENADYRLCFHLETYSAGGGEERGIPSSTEESTESTSVDALAADPVAGEENSYIEGGYRIGANIDLNESTDYIRYVYQEGGPAAVVEAKLPDTGAEASTPLLIAGGLFALGLSVVAVGALRRRAA